MTRIKDKSLYLVLSKEYEGDEDFLKVAETAVSAGIDVLQMREKVFPAKGL
ncbi:MAG: thiamine phosphate synthase [Candidatus Omnitrophica bacterium]|nr:thiamine phosphate synthase [Candidatus Omnitrophota bacterium]